MKLKDRLEKSIQEFDNVNIDKENSEEKIDNEGNWPFYNVSNFWLLGVRISSW